ncbi:hypothetical protein LCGC14_0914030 [marine sediment metagenome]|uniref:Nucleotide-diphospho-sugar transferase domain-containing protein n=1 Tax=marine sediment metagenome TaxID=412755 RepID=A0A0F9RZF4_9ZZZZ
MSNRITIITSCEFRQNNVRSKNYEPMAKRLVHSIRTNGGKYNDAHIVMYHSEDAKPSQETCDWLSRNGCTIISGGPDLIPGEPVGNKIQACNTRLATEYGLWVDTDMYVLDTQLFEDLIDKNVDVAATGSEYGHHRWGRLSDGPIWEQLYALAGVPAPLETFTGGLDGEPVHFYFNSAIVLFRNGRGFAEAWKDLAVKVRFSGIENTEHNFTQTSLTLAALKTNGQCEQLPQTYNAYYGHEQEKTLDQAVLHYQGHVIDFDSRVKWDV